MTDRSRRVVVTVMALCAGWVSVEGPPLFAQTQRFSLVSTIRGAADLIEVADSRAYVSAEQTLTVFDVSDPAAPRRGGSYTFPEKIWGYQVVGAVVYAAVDFFGLGVVDVSDMAAPRLQASHTTPGQAKGVAVFGTKALVADHVEGVDLIDLSSPTEPVAVGSFYLDGYARDVTALGPLAYAVDAPTGVYVFDLSSSNPLEPIGTVQTATAPSSIEVPSGAADERPDVVCMVGGGLLQVFDISNPAEPVRVGELGMPSGRPRRVTMSGRLAYVADGPSGVHVVDLTTPSEPAIVDTSATSRPARDVAVAASHIFVAVGEHEGDEAGGVVILKWTP
jgi:hypothetical protein